MTARSCRAQGQSGLDRWGNGERDDIDGRDETSDVIESSGAVLGRDLGGNRRAPRPHADKVDAGVGGERRGVDAARPRSAADEPDSHLLRHHLLLSPNRLDDGSQPAVCESRPVRYIIFGAGGIGGTIGACLHQAGHDVLLVARGAHYEAIKADGLRFETPEQSVVLDVPVVDRPEAVGWRNDDAAVLAMKSQDTASALAALAAVAPSSLPVACAQNGVENERATLRHFEHVYGICVMCPTSFLQPGVVQAYSAPLTGLLDLGRYPSGVDTVAEEMASALASSTFASEARRDIMRWKYGKLLLNLTNALIALAGPEAARADLAKQVRAEAVACLQAAGIEFVDRDEDRARRGDLLTMRPIGGAHRRAGSTWQSLERGLGTVETDYLNGEIVLLGRLHGVPTPVNELLQRLTADAARGGTAPGTVPVDHLEAALAVGS